MGTTQLSTIQIKSYHLPEFHLFDLQLDIFLCHLSIQRQAS